LIGEGAGERTQLAWQRFALALAVVGALGLRAGVAHRHSSLGFVVAGIMGAFAAMLQVAGPRLRPGSAVRLALAATLAAAAGAIALAVA
jgi:uncharacterized membrane protein YidH (DUF202 family)